ncbi:MAG: MGMT family protein [Planctomycetota bacterium]|jgi:alkylated DNA nucleotide flippase Atl1
MSKATWKLRKGVTWRQKLEQAHPSHGKIVPIPERFQKRLGKGTMLIPRPTDVDALMKKPRKGKVITQGQLRDALAKNAGTDSSCPMTTGMFARIAAEAAEEDLRAGKKRITPYWRTVKDNGSLNPKFPGGVEKQAAMLQHEGVEVAPGQGKSAPRVVDLEKRMVKL